MKIKRIEHIAIAVKSIPNMREIFEKKLGFEMEYEENLPHYNTKLAMFPIGQTYLELLESDAPHTETSRWIAERGEGLFHICLEVEDIVAALAELKGRGVGLLDEVPRIGHGGSKIAFLDPKTTGDLVIELCELSADHGAAHAA
jgi:methylmalonyl-CoA/ethylmalonyl-CoA epimerase